MVFSCIERTRIRDKMKDDYRQRSVSDLFFERIKNERSFLSLCRSREQSVALKTNHYSPSREKQLSRTSASLFPNNLCTVFLRTVSESCWFTLKKIRSQSDPAWKRRISRERLKQNGHNNETVTTTILNLHNTTTFYKPTTKQTNKS